MKLNIRSFIGVLAIGIAGFIFSCSSPQADTEAVTKTEETAPEAEARDTPASDDFTAGPDTVIIYRMQFTPANINVKKGDTVVWINKDIVVHDVTEKDKLWTSGNIPNDGTTAFKRVADSSFDYFCSIHPTMTASVTVQ